MREIHDTTESDGYCCSKGQDGYVGEDYGWETEDPFACTREYFKVNKDLINFVSKKITLEQLFNSRYNISFDEKYSPSGWRFVRRCPFPDHRDSDPSFNYNKEEDRFYCFGCKRGGKSVQFMAHMENISVSTAAERLLEGIGSIEEVYLNVEDTKESRVDELLLEFSEYIHAFMMQHGMSKDAIKFAETITWALDIYLQKHLPRSTIDESNLSERLRFLRNKLNEYVE